MMKNTILLTGISGYIGLHCAKELLDAGYNVRGSIRNQVKGQEVLDTLTAASVDTTNLTLIELDLTSNRGWDEAAAGCEFVMHVASPFVLANPKEPKDLISPAIAVFHLDVGLLGYRVQVLMHRLQQHRKHLLRIVLGKSLELDSLPCDPILDVPRRNIPRLAHPQVLQ